MYFNNHELPELLEFSSLHVFYVFNNHELREFLKLKFRMCALKGQPAYSPGRCPGF